MKQRLISCAVIITFIVFLSGCQSIPQEHKGVAVGAGSGAATGAVVGAVIGAVIGKSTKGAVIGALLDVLVGGAIGHYAYDKHQTSSES